MFSGGKIMNEFQAGQSADQVHSALKSSLQAMEKAQQCAVRWFESLRDPASR